MPLPLPLVSDSLLRPGRKGEGEEGDEKRWEEEGVEGGRKRWVEEEGGEKWREEVEEVGTLVVVRSCWV